MKKLYTILLTLTISLFLTACGSSSTPQTSDSTEKSTGEQSSLASPKPKIDGKALIVYFSLPETTNPGNMTEEEANSTVVIDGKVLGNTQYVANVIQKNTGADIFRLEPETPYTTNHKALVDLAKQERNNNARPELKANIANLDQYDTIFIGYPIWWSDFPMIFYTFFDKNDFSGKTIIPFSTHGGSRLAGTVQTLTTLEPNATVVQKAFTVSRDNVQEAEPDIIAWLAALGYVNKK